MHQGPLRQSGHWVPRSHLEVAWEGQGLGAAASHLLGGLLSAGQGTGCGGQPLWRRDLEWEPWVRCVPIPQEFSNIPALLDLIKGLHQERALISPKWVKWALISPTGKATTAGSSTREGEIDLPP